PAGPCICYIWSPTVTLHSLYLVSHRPCIHCICSPTVHRIQKCYYFSKYKLLYTFSHQQLQQSCDFSRALAKACRRSFLFCS
ncbi:unnamed protein product, partial [Staurois parvus]